MSPWVLGVDEAWMPQLWWDPWLVGATKKNINWIRYGGFWDTQFFKKKKLLNQKTKKGKTTGSEKPQKVEKLQKEQLL